MHSEYLISRCISHCPVTILPVLSVRVEVIWGLAEV
jgi:hypothetical protein